MSTNKTTSATDLVNRLYAYDVPNSGSRDGQEFLNEVADTITRLQAALDELKHDVARQMSIANAECNRAEFATDGLNAIIASNDEWSAEDLREIARAALKASVGGE